MENNYFKRIEINGDVNNLPPKEGIYYVSFSGCEDTFYYQADDDFYVEQWLTMVDFYLLPVPSPDSVIVGPTEEMIEKWAEENCIEEGLGSYHGDLFDCKVQGANWYRSQCHAVNLKDELVKFITGYNSLYKKHENETETCMDTNDAYNYFLPTVDDVDYYLSGKGKEGIDESK